MTSDANTAARPSDARAASDSAPRPLPPSGRVHPELSTTELTAVRRFDDPRYEWRRLFGELFGTYLLVIAGAGGAFVDGVTHGAIDQAAQAVAPGLMVMVIILSMGAISGAHLNPVVSVAFALRTDFAWQRIPGYVLAQLAGGVLAVLTLLATFGSQAGDGATVPSAAIDDAQAFIVEALLTMGLVTTILGAASGAQNIGPLSALAVGGYIILAGLWTGPLTGASMNPARSFGPALVSGEYGHLWVYVAGPALGMLVAVGIAFILRGGGGDPQARKMATGAPPD